MSFVEKIGLSTTKGSLEKIQQFSVLSYVLFLKIMHNDAFNIFVGHLKILREIDKNNIIGFSSEHLPIGNL